MDVFNFPENNISRSINQYIINKRPNSTINSIDPDSVNLSQLDHVMTLKFSINVHLTSTDKEHARMFILGKYVLLESISAINTCPT